MSPPPAAHRLAGARLRFQPLDGDPTRYGLGTLRGGPHPYVKILPAGSWSKQGGSRGPPVALVAAQGGPSAVLRGQTPNAPHAAHGKRRPGRLGRRGWRVGGPLDRRILQDTRRGSFLVVCSGGEQIPRWDCSAPSAARFWPGTAVYLVGRKRSSRLNETRDSVHPGAGAAAVTIPLLCASRGPNQPPLDNNGWTERCVTGVGWMGDYTGKEKRAALCG